MPLPYRRLVVKIGSNVLTQPSGLPDEDRLAQLVAQLVALRSQGCEVIVVSSGAVAAGRSLITLPPRADAVRSRQLLAAVGQVKLLSLYAALLASHGRLGAQVLVTKEDFRDRQHYRNMKNCFQELLQQNVIPIVNENDVVSVTELMFTDNDELAGLVASMLDADALLILSNVDGIFDGDPAQPGAQVIRRIAPADTSFAEFVTATRSQFGRGGMLTKCSIAHKVAGLGISVHIANGKTPDILLGILNETAVSTWFQPSKRASGTKKWLAHAQAAQATVQVNAGARAALLAPGQALGLGLAEYGSDKARERLGQHGQRPLVHYDYLFLTAEG